MSKRAFFAATALLLGLVTAILVAPVLWLMVDEAAVPPITDLPALPAGVTVDDAGVSCGSGGCWRELAVHGPADQSPDQIATRVRPSGEVCRARSLLDRREVCTGVRVIGERVLLYLQFDRPLD